MYKVSIIIPCYNSAKTVEETFQSVINLEYNNWEAIIVNDGSPDNIEDIAKYWVNLDSRFRYYKKENGGLGTARNFGISKSSGQFILPLDSDNKIRRDFLSNAIPIFQVNPNIGVVYGNAKYFGEKNGIWEVGDFDALKLASSNYIDACALIRKELYNEVGMYDVDFPFQGIEDWEFWIRVLKSKYEFYYLEKICFDYRVLSNSMIRSFDQKMYRRNMIYFYKKHHRYLLQLIFQKRENDSNFKFKIWHMYKEVAKGLLGL